MGKEKKKNASRRYAGGGVRVGREGPPAGPPRLGGERTGDPSTEINRPSARREGSARRGALRPNTALRRRAGPAAYEDYRFHLSPPCWGGKREREMREPTLSATGRRPFAGGRGRLVGSATSSRAAAARVFRGAFWRKLAPRAWKAGGAVRGKGAGAGAGCRPAACSAPRRSEGGRSTFSRGASRGGRAGPGAGRSGEPSGGGRARRPAVVGWPNLVGAGRGFGRGRSGRAERPCSRLAAAGRPRSCPLRAGRVVHRGARAFTPTMEAPRVSPAAMMGRRDQRGARAAPRGPTPQCGAPTGQEYEPAHRPASDIWERWSH